ncbi:hypothetical protein CsatB_011168 [Cannabis sativa]
MALYGEAETTSSSIGEDRISMLPDALITHILSFLPTDDAVRTCLISNRWKLIWHSIPTLSFSDIDYVSPQNLYKFVNDYLKHRKRGMYYNIPSVITSFKLDMKYCYQTTKSVFLDKWLDFAVKNKVKEIHVCLNSYSEGENNYWLTETVFNAKYLTVLELERLDLNAAYSISLPALKTLSLKFCFFHGDGLSKILIGCPSLEKLQILTCVSIKSIDKLRLESSTLKFLKIENFFNASFDIVPVQVEATNLESLDIRGFFDIQNSCSSVCKAIRNLTLTFYDDDCIEDTSSLNYIISNLPVLENLTLKDCYRLKLKHRLLIKISNQQLKSFNLKNEGSKYESYNHGMSIIIESAPKLESFYYEGNINFSIATESSNLLNGKFVIFDQHENYDSNWFNSMMIFLLNLNCSWNIVTLHVHSDKDLILSEDLKRLYRSPLLNWKHLKIITDDKPQKESDLKDALMWISPSLETLSINENAIL